MRNRRRNKTRSPLTTDIHKLYTAGFAAAVVSPILCEVLNEKDFEIEFCQHILAKAPDHPEALALLGESYTKRGEYEKGLEADLRLSRLQPESAVVQYNLACSYALTERKKLALEALEKAVALGYRDLEHLRNDRDLAVLRGDPRYEGLCEKLQAEQHEAEPK